MDDIRWGRWCAAAVLTIAVSVNAATPATTAAPSTAPSAGAPTAGTSPTAPAASPTTTPAAPPPTAVNPPPAPTAAPSATAPGNGAPLTRTAYRAALDKAAAEYNRHRAACRPMKGNDRTVCIAEAKAESKRAESAAEAAFRNTARARMDARVIAANADYAVAKARCNAKSGTERRNCLKMAKEKQSEVVSAAMRAPL